MEKYRQDTDHAWTQTFFGTRLVGVDEEGFVLLNKSVGNTLDKEAFENGEAAVVGKFLFAVLDGSRHGIHVIKKGQRGSQKADAAAEQPDLLFRIQHGIVPFQLRVVRHAFFVCEDSLYSSLCSYAVFDALAFSSSYAVPWGSMLMLYAAALMLCR